MDDATQDVKGGHESVRDSVRGTNAEERRATMHQPLLTAKHNRSDAGVKWTVMPLVP